MKKNKYALLLIVLAINTVLYGQHALFLSEGQIEYERKINLHSQLDDDNAWSELQKKTMPKFKTSYFNLFFSKDKTYYLPGRGDNNEMQTSLLDHASRLSGQTAGH